jgi:two-component system, cell cycle response regulator DivK
MGSLMGQPPEQKQVLVIEDNRLTMALLRTVLRSAGHAVIEAGSAREGLEAAVRCRPALIVMDIKLPDISGFDATRTLKTGTATSGIPVVITSAYGAEANQERLRDCGCDAYIPAPITVSGFLDVIRSFIDAGIDTGSARREEQHEP